MYEKLTMIINSQRKLKLGGLFSKLIQLIPNIYSSTGGDTACLERTTYWKRQSLKSAFLWILPLHTQENILWSKYLNLLPSFRTNASPRSRTARRWRTSRWSRCTTAWTITACPSSTRPRSPWVTSSLVLLTIHRQPLVGAFSVIVKTNRLLLMVRLQH